MLAQGVIMAERSMIERRTPCEARMLHVQRRIRVLDYIVPCATDREAKRTAMTTRLRSLRRT